MRDGTFDPSIKNRVVVSAKEAFRLLNIDKATGYKAIRDGTFPVPVVHVGKLIRIPTAALLKVLHLEPDTAPGGSEA
jgi:predicted DNA-binding transcriptional regulator AlpA